MNLDPLIRKLFKQGRRYSTTRYTMYNSIADWIKTNKPRGEVLIISERKEYAIRDMFPSGCRFTATQYPETDIMNLSKFPHSHFDTVVTDQVLEHVPDPFKANRQIYRILKKGGLVINTSCAFNPVHDNPDYYRFTKQGFAQIHKIFKEICLLGSWGNRRAIEKFVAAGYKSFDVRKDPHDYKLAIENDDLWPWSVWCIARK